MKKPFALLGCTIQAHVKPDNRRMRDARADAGFNLGTSMEHHQCYRMHISNSRLTQISVTVSFQHQYITNSVIPPKSNVIATAQKFASALKGNISTEAKTVEALTKVSKLFTKIVALATSQSG